MVSSTPKAQDLTEGAGVGARDLTPPGWPPEVLPPQAPDWERSAVGWLFDLCPADYRAHEVLRHHPVVLARFAAGHVESAVDAARLVPL